MEKSKIVQGRCKLLVIGGSAGSIDTLLKILPGLNQQASFPIVIVLHRKKSSDSTLIELLSTRTTLPIKEVDDKDLLKPGNIYVVPADYHLLFEKNKMLSLDYSEKINYSRPSIDVTFESAAEVFGSGLTCLLLSGANADGSHGMQVVKQNGGQIAVQNPQTAESPQMPEHAISKAGVKLILNIEEMIEFINSL